MPTTITLDHEPNYEFYDNGRPHSDTPVIVISEGNDDEGITLQIYVEEYNRRCEPIYVITHDNERAFRHVSGETWEEVTW